MKKLSKWAKINRTSARIIIVLSHLLVVMNAIFFGILLFVFDWGASRWLLPLFANLFFLAYIFYPEKRKNKAASKRSYIRQKAHDFGLVICYSLVLSLGVNNFLTPHTNDYTLVQQPTAHFMAFKPKAEKQTSHQEKPKPEAKAKLRASKKQIRSEFQALKKELKRQNGDGDQAALKIFLILLTIGAVIGLGYLIALLSCRISCSGSVGIALITFVLGWAGIVWLGVLAIKNIAKAKMSKKSRERNEVPTE